MCTKVSQLVGLAVNVFGLRMWAFDCIWQLEYLKERMKYILTVMLACTVQDWPKSSVRKTAAIQEFVEQALILYLTIQAQCRSCVAYMK